MARNTISTAESSRDSASNNWREYSERLQPDGPHPSDASIAVTMVVHPELLRGGRGFLLVGESAYLRPSEARAVRAEIADRRLTPRQGSRHIEFGD